MGTISAATIVSKVALLLFDVNNTKWSVAELLMWLSDAQRATVALLPEAGSSVTVMQLTAGARQALPAGSLALLECTRNMGTNGTTPGRALKHMDRAKLDETNPTWPSQPGVSAPTGYMYNRRDKGFFYVNPPADGTGYIEINVAVEPPEITQLASTITIDDIYSPALVDYVLWRANSKPVPWADPKAAQTYFTSWAMYVTRDAAAASRLAQQMGALSPDVPQMQGSQAEGA